ncbi:MAG: hypothetical protein IPH35_01755 [Rhodoferax sp.]|nr:hypothetical protein [Rhodoferax sp.]
MQNLPILSTSQVLPRLVQTSLQDSLTDTPVVLLQGPRQCGKTTLARCAGRPTGAPVCVADASTDVREQLLTLQ